MITVDYRDRRPLYQQLIDNIEALIASGLLAADEQLPSVRQLAVELAINPNTIQKAYSELDRRGVVYSVPGKGSFVSIDALEKIGDRRRLKLKEMMELMQEMFVSRVT